MINVNEYFKTSCVQYLVDIGVHGYAWLRIFVHLSIDRYLCFINQRIYHTSVIWCQHKSSRLTCEHEMACYMPVTVDATAMGMKTHWSFLTKRWIFESRVEDDTPKISPIASRSRFCSSWKQQLKFVFRNDNANTGMFGWCSVFFGTQNGATSFI